MWCGKSNAACQTKTSVLLVGELLYIISDAGIASCIEAATGKALWQEPIGGEFSASPAYADGKIWLFSEDGKISVIAPGKTFQLLAENQPDDGFMASPAILGSAPYLRREPICIGLRRATRRRLRVR